MIRLSVFQANGTTAVGIVTNVLTVSYGQEVNSIGSWSATIPADSAQALYFGDRYRVKIDIGGEGYVFQGIVTKRQTRVNGETKVLEVSGWSTARELVDLDTGQGFELENDSLTDAFDAILAVEGTWATGTVGSPSLAVWSRRFDGVKLWQGLVKLADMFGVLFREDSRDRTIDAGAFGDDSGLTFKNWEGPVPPDLATDNPSLVLLNGIDVAVETQDIITRVEPFGQRQGITGDKVTLEHATDTTLYTTQSSTRNSLDYFYLVDSTAETAYGRIEASIIVSDVLPLGLDPTTDFVRAANALHGVAATWLSRRKDPLRSYTLRVEGLRHIVSSADTFLVGQKARVVYQGASKSPDGTVVWLDLDEDLWIMGYRRSVGSDGKSTWQLRVSNVTRDVPDSTTKLADLYEQFDASLTAPWPILSWGGTPPVGRLTPDGAQLEMKDAQDLRTSYAWRSNAFQDYDAMASAFRSWAIDPETIDMALVNLSVKERTDEYAGATLGIGDGPGELYDAMATVWSLNVQDTFDYPVLEVACPQTETGFWVKRASEGEWEIWLKRGGVLQKFGGGMELIIKEADESVNNGGTGTTLQNDDELVIPIGANERIQFEGYLFATGSTPDIKIAATGPSGAVGRISVGSVGSQDLGGSGVTVNLDADVAFRGAVDNGGTAGNITIQWAQNSASPNNTTVHAGSYIKWQKQ